MKRVKQGLAAALVIFCAGIPGAAEGAVPGGGQAAAFVSRPLRQRQGAADLPLPAPAADPAALSIDGLDRELTRRYIAQYAGTGGIAWLNSIIRRGSPYIPFIREELERRGLPPELLYLPVIESGYNPRAISRSGAAGLWQFMKNSMRPFGMTVTELVDERMDFWKSTQGALSKLEENYRHFGDWALALAAYNAGLGGVNRVVQRTGLRDYWALCERKELRTETIHYVPKFLAAAHILSNPRRYGLDYWPEAPDWTRIPTDRSADLEVLAELAGLDREILETANPELLRRITPASNYQLKVPAAAAPALLAALEQRDLKLIRHYSYTIRSGDTLSALGRHYGVGVDLIQDMNPGLRPQALRIGQVIRIPALREVAPYERAGGTGGRAFTGTHLVKRGESLWAIALAYDVDPEELAAANNMGLDDILPEGKILKTPTIE